ncbi:hypothetical protein [Anaeromicropila herbilytica]|uniref:PilZ domain-containing protein n=1 Tax=Anaeromicropila herbilytica TaxID=2785025 RepID=A0A7R7EJ08_9FIRM|nr:hypothetical protein [Anaeromicropila herbilytica]BCN29653.1 hypothetical protein bsdtb5_09480 [Anaeromicropila herbilytica]
MAILKESYKDVNLLNSITLEIHNILFQDCDMTKGEFDSDIEVIDVSRKEIHFISTKPLLIGYYFDSKIQLGDSFQFNVSIRINKCIQLNDGEYKINAEFIGMEPYVAEKISKFKGELKQ